MWTILRQQHSFSFHLFLMNFSFLRNSVCNSFIKVFSSLQWMTLSLILFFWNVVLPWKRSKQYKDLKTFIFSVKRSFFPHTQSEDRPSTHSDIINVTITCIFSSHLTSSFFQWDPQTILTTTSTVSYAMLRC